ncbi:MAG: GldG family protein [Deltaproteobacteria bacterium]|nr:GldG family protein [Deltaproteobacteria bacterium]
MRKKSTFQLSSTAYIILVVSLVVLVNLISFNTFTQLDLTRSGLYTLSPASKKIFENLNDNVLVKVFFTPDLPAPYNNNARYLRDMLQEFKTFSKGKLKFEFIDPSTDPKSEEQAKRLGVPPVQINVMRKDKFEVKQVYMGMAFLYLDKSEMIPVVKGSGGLEYDITSTIKKLTSDKAVKIGLLAPQSTPMMGQGGRAYNRLNQLLAKNYQVVPLTLDKEKPIDKDMDLLILAGPEKPLEPWQEYRVDQFIMGGGKVAFFVEKVNANMQYGMARAVNKEMDPWLENYGFKVNNDLVIDIKNARITIQQQSGGMTIASMVNYPFFPVISDFPKDSPMVRDLSDLTLFFTSSLEKSKQAGDQVVFTPVAQSSSTSGVLTDPFAIDPYQKFTKEQFNGGAKTLVATVIGAFKSYFKDGLPKDIKEDKERLPEGKKTRLVVVGNARILEDEYTSGRSNMAFILNAVDWLAQEEDLIAIRSKGEAMPPLTEISDGAKVLIKYINVIAAPILFILFGLIYWQARKRRAKEVL